MEGVGKGVLVFCKVAEGQLGRGGGKGKQAPGLSSMLRRVRQLREEFTEMSMLLEQIPRKLWSQICLGSAPELGGSVPSLKTCS